MTSIDSLADSAFQSDGLPEQAEYRSVSRLAVFALVLSLIGLLGFSISFVLFLPAVAFFCAIVSYRTIRTFPTEYTGSSLAKIALVISAVTLLLAPIRHYYIYLTEVPEGYERISFSELKSGYGAPDVPPPAALNLNGKQVFLKGYILSNSLASKTVKNFILVPDFATCCFGGEPPLTHKIQVELAGDQVVNWKLRRYNLAGTLHVDPVVQPGISGGGVYYTLKADFVQ